MRRIVSLLLLLITGQKDIVKDFFSSLFLLVEEVCFKMSNNNKIRRTFESTIEYRYHQTCIDWIDGFAFEFDGQMMHVLPALLFFWLLSFLLLPVLYMFFFIIIYILCLVLKTNW